MPRFLQILLLVIAPLAVFGAMVWVDRAFGRPSRGYGYVVHVDLPPSGPQLGLPTILGPADASRPLVVIDAGHGGKDPGAGAGGVQEKDLTLALALALRDELVRRGGVRVALTRSDDTYLYLPERSGLARRLGGDLFLSIHADSTEGSSGATGATVYTLSEKGTTQVADKMAARENGADQLNGVKLGDQSDDVSAILVDLSQRDTRAGSEEFGRLILREGKGKIAFRENAVQSAAFAVLKSPDIPSVLFEAGYINNPADAERLTSRGGRAAFSEAMARAIQVFFARRSAPVVAQPR